MVQPLHAPLQTLNAYGENNANKTTNQENNNQFRDILKSEMKAKATTTSNASKVKEVIKNDLQKLNPDQTLTQQEVTKIQDLYESEINTYIPKTSAGTLENLSVKDENGTEIALRKDMWEYAKLIEKKMRVIMLGFAFKLPKLEEGPNMIDLLYGDDFISNKIDEMYGIEGGDLAKSIMEKFEIDYADLIKQEVNNEKRTN